MLGAFRLCAALWLAMVLVGCGGGGDSSVTKVTGAGLNTLGQSPAVSLNAVQTDNNLLVSVSDGPRGFQLAPNANLLYATVRVCHPVSGQCVDIDHVQVDTGSVGLRVLASKVKALNLPPVQVVLTNSPQLHNAYECYPFVIGGLWGPTVTAVVGLGRQLTSPVAVHLIEDNTKAVEALQAPDNCVQAAGQVMSDAGSLGSNGILGIGSTTLDCGDVCVGGTYGANDFVQYYGYPPGSTGTAQCGTDLSLCSIAKVPPNLQV